MSVFASFVFFCLKVKGEKAKKYYENRFPFPLSTEVCALLYRIKTK